MPTCEKIVSDFRMEKPNNCYFCHFVHRNDVEVMYEEEHFDTTKEQQEAARRGKKFVKVFGRKLWQDGIVVEFRYSREEWSVDEAKDHCKRHRGMFFEVMPSFLLDEGEKECQKSSSENIEQTDGEK